MSFTSLEKCLQSHEDHEVPMANHKESLYQASHLGRPLYGMTKCFSFYENVIMEIFDQVP